MVRHTYGRFPFKSHVLTSFYICHKCTLSTIYVSDTLSRHFCFGLIGRRLSDDKMMYLAVLAASSVAIATAAAPATGTCMCVTTSAVNARDKGKTYFVIFCLNVKFREISVKWTQISLIVKFHKSRNTIEHRLSIKRIGVRRYLLYVVQYLEINTKWI